MFILEIISLFIITRHIGALASLKGLDSRRWKIYSIFTFFILELAGYCFAVLIFAKDNYVSIGLVGFAFGITSYPVIEKYLSNLPDPNQTNDN